MIGSLMYLTASRLDIMFAVCACARFQVTPKTSHLLAVKRIFRYLKGKLTLGLWYPRDSLFELVAYSDSDYAGATQDRKSTTRGCQFLGNRLVSWQCKKQTVVATSTTEAEYVAAASCCGQCWLNTTQQMVINSPCLTVKKELAIPGQTTTDAVTLLKRIRKFFIADAVTLLVDMLLYLWDGGLDVCVDLTGSSPLTQTGMADFVPGRAVIDKVICKPVDISCWVSLLVLPLCLLKTFCPRSNLECVPGGSLQLVRDTLAKSASPMLDMDEKDLDLSEQNLKQCKRKIYDGHYTEAVRVLSSYGIAPYNDATLQELKAKHPFKSGPSLPDIPIDHHQLITSHALVLDRIKSYPHGTSCGRDGLRAQHLMDCLSGTTVAISDELVSSITQKSAESLHRVPRSSEFMLISTESDLECFPWLQISQE
ncbi:hypothetical protein Tco_0999916 [Tanacetum coccineum]